MPGTAVNLKEDQLATIFKVFLWLSNQTDAFEDALAAVESDYTDTELKNAVKNLADEDMMPIRSTQELMLGHDVLKAAIPYILMREVVEHLEGELPEEEGGMLLKVDKNTAEMLAGIEMVSSAFCYFLDHRSGKNVEEMIGVIKKGLEEFGMRIGDLFDNDMEDDNDLDTG